MGEYISDDVIGDSNHKKASCVNFGLLNQVS